MNEFVLIDAISYLDADLLEKHLEQKEKLKAKAKSKKRVRIMRWSAIAACICVFVVASVIIMPHLNDLLLENPNNLHFQGDVVETEKGTLTLTHVNTATQQISFQFSKDDNSVQYVVFNGYCVVNEWVGDDGVPYQDVKHYDIISQYDGYQSDNGNEIIDDMLIIIVNGQETNMLPNEKGTYEITIDYSKLLECLDHIEPVIEVSGFGKFVIDSSYFGK